MKKKQFCFQSLSSTQFNFKINNNQIITRPKSQCEYKQFVTNNRKYTSFNLKEDTDGLNDGYIAP